MARRNRNLKKPISNRELNALRLVYTRAQVAIEKEIKAAAAAGNAGTEAYLQARRVAIARILQELQKIGDPLLRIAASKAFVAQAQITQQDIIQITGQSFATPNERVIETLVDNSINKLGEARASIGRQADDAIRQIALETLSETQAEGLVAPKAQERLAAAYEKAGLTTGKNGVRFIQIQTKSGPRNFALADYAKLVSRTTVNEAATAAVVESCQQAEIEQVTVTVAANPCDICEPYEGQTYSVDDLENLPPYHPNCTHTIYAASDSDYPTAEEAARINAAGGEE